MCTVLATALTAVSGIMQGVAANRAAQAEADAANRNARIAEAQSTDAVARGGKEELQQRRKMAILQGEQRAALAASGVNVDSGSALAMQDASASEGEQDAAAIRFNAAREAWGHNVQATNFRNQASAAKAKGRNALTGGLIKGGTSLLSLAQPTTNSSRAKIRAGAFGGWTT